MMTTPARNVDVVSLATPVPLLDDETDCLFFVLLFFLFFVSYLTFISFFTARGVRLCDVEGSSMPSLGNAVVTTTSPDADWFVDDENPSFPFPTM